MPLFSYSAKDTKGEVINGSMEAENNAAATILLISNLL